MKQILLIRKDLKMRRGKEIAQGAHASLAVVLEHMNHPYIKEWLADSFTKIAVSVDSLDELLELTYKAKEAGIPMRVITDNGLTEFHGVPTVTCAAIGPAPAEMLNPITGHLKLL